MKNIGKRAVGALLALAVCAGLQAVLPTAAAESLQERQQAVVAAAMAYYDKGEAVQYDGVDLVFDVPRADGGKTRSTNQEPPEYGTPAETIYSVCSDFCHQVYWEAFHYQLCGSAGATKTYRFRETKPDDPTFVYEYRDENGKDRDTELRKMYRLLQPGDIITNWEKEGAHAMVFVGDALGDGVNYLAHCYGSTIDLETGFDTRECPTADPANDTRFRSRVFADAKGGSIRLTPCTEDSFAAQKKKIGVIAIRPLAAMTESAYPILPQTRYRMTHPRLAIDRVVEGKTRFLSTFPGETLTLGVKLTNSSGAAYTLPVTEKIPAGVRFRSASDGGAVSGDTVTWNVDLPAGGEKTVTVEYEVTAAVGEQIVFTGGSVGDIPSNTIPIAVGGKKLSAEKRAKLAAIVKGEYDNLLAAERPSGKTLPGVVYRKILGLNVEFPTEKQIVVNLTEDHVCSDGRKVRTFRAKESVAQEDLPAYRMKVPFFHGGRQIWNEWGHERMSDPKDIHVEPGDVIVRLTNVKNPNLIESLIYLGDGKYLFCDAKKALRIAEEPELVRSIISNAFYCLRPTLAYEDIETLSIPTELPAAQASFTDVKESDWFYPYVTELAAKGVVNGMTATTFVPNGTLTYGQALKLVALAVGEGKQQPTGSHWASGYQRLAREKGWLTGSVEPDKPIRRLPFCRIAAKAKGLTEQPASNPFTDTADKDVLALFHAGIINGMTATTFDPQGLLTRAQIAKIIRMMQ